MKTIKNEYLFSERVNQIPKSFIREILKVTSQPDVISFAGGLPNPSYFPVEAIKEAAIKVLDNDGKNVLQYAVSEGYLPLREYIAARYVKSGMEVHPDEILITNGSQQGLDLVGKVFIDHKDKVLLERPSYLGAIQSFSVYQPTFLTADLLEDGIDMPALSQVLSKHALKLFYTIPNFQNPTGISYSEKRRIEVAHEIEKFNTLVVEDDPYGEIRFTNTELSPIKKFLPEKTILLGSFSKIISPGMRLGWVVANKKIIEKMILAKQATDLHSNYFSQRVIYQYLTDNNLDLHINKIKEAYKDQRDSMLHLMDKFFPKEAHTTHPEGGMFLWVTLPSHCSTFALLEEATREKVAFVPGRIFYLDDIKDNTMRLNFSNTTPTAMEKGIERLGRILYRNLERKS